MVFTSGVIGAICFLMVSPKRRKQIMVTSRRQYVKMAILFRTEQLFSNVERRFELITELADITVDSKNIKLQ